MKKEEDHKRTFPKLGMSSDPVCLCSSCRLITSQILDVSDEFYVFSELSKEIKAPKSSVVIPTPTKPVSKEGGFEVS